MNKVFSDKITRINFILIVMIVMLHSNCLRFLEEYSTFTYVLYRMLYVLCDAAVPTFFLISAYLFYRNYTNSKIKEKYLSRLHSLVIPYFIWSIVFLIYYTFINKIPVVSMYFDNNFDLSTNNILNNILMANCAEGMWFIRCLIVYVIVSPLIYNVFKFNKIINYIIIFFLIIMNIFFKINYSNPLFWLPLYLIGSSIGILCKNIGVNEKIFKNSKKTAIILMLVFLMIIYLLIDVDNTSIKYYLYRIISPFFVIYIFDSISNIKQIRDIEKYSFLIFCLHLPLLKVVRKLQFIIVGYNQYISFVVYIVTIIATTSLIYIFGKLLNKHFPNAYKVISGSR